VTPCPARGLDINRRQTWFSQAIPDHDGTSQQSVDEEHWEHYNQDLFDTYPERSGDLRSIVRISDFYSARQWHATGVYHDHYRRYGLEHELQLCLPVAPEQAGGRGRTVRLWFTRGPGPDFSERDRALLTLLRPHLHQAYLDAERRRCPVPQLTPRHWDLLHLVADGHTNAQIGRRLGITEGTVRKHLENIYTRLQVSSRTAAITRAFQDRMT
jgi:DNA-binding CsgD family transcriptional regulator